MSKRECAKLIQWIIMMETSVKENESEENTSRR